MKLAENNNWGNLTYKVGEAPLTPLNRWISIKLRSRWQRFKIDWKLKYDTVSDMGRSYEVSSQVPHIYIDFKGVSIMLPLAKFIRQDMRIPK